MTGTRQFAVGEDSFLLGGEPFRVLSGALHYFRVHPGQWADRIRKARLMGLNTIETYVAWNAHAPLRDEFHLDGGADLGRFLDLVAAEGMHAIIRPGPYICAEWTNGGLPGWLREVGVRDVRSTDPVFLAEVRKYLAQLAPVIVPRQATSGGPVILMQVENEYGAHGRDKQYLAELADAIRDIGITVPLITVDQPTGSMLDDGSLDGVLATGSFGGHVPQRLEALRDHQLRHQTPGPLMCTEFWCGWFDSWGDHHHLTSAPEAAGHLDDLLRAGASVNIYMFHGGTNFGLTSGANDKGTYHPITTSYDYDAPLDEAGRPTAKYWAFREVIARHAPVPGDAELAAAGLTTSVPAAPVLTAALSRTVPLWDVARVLDTPARHDAPPTTDEIGQYQGLTLYAADIDAARLPGGGGDPVVLRAEEVRDRAQVFLNRQSAGVLAREHHEAALVLPAGARGRLEILVEDQGRVDYGPRVGETKGLIGPVTLGGEVVSGWDTWRLVLDDIEPVAAQLRAQPPAEPSAPPPNREDLALSDLEPRAPELRAPELRAPELRAPELAGPAFARAAFDLLVPADLFLSTAGWGKGIAWLNGLCLGRFWSRGPQRTLYVPGPATRAGRNELIILELNAATAIAVFAPGPDLGHTEH
jgi:beta-galactosidase